MESDRPLDPAEWKAFLAERPDASVYHTPEFQRALHLSGQRCLVETVRRDGRLAGLGLVLLDQLFPLPVVGRKAFAPAGLPCVDEEARQELLERLDRRLRGQCLYFERYVESRDEDGLAELRGEATSRYRNFLVDLGQDPATIRARYSRGTRRNVRQAEQIGFRWRLARTPEDLAVCHTLLLETSRRVGAPPLPKALLKAVHHELVPAGMARLYLAEPEGRPEGPVSARVELLFQGRATDWFTGTAEAWVESQVGTWLVDRILVDLHERGVSLFDFGGAGRLGESYGPAEFKRRFGGREIELSRHQKTYHPLLKRLARKGWRWLRRA